MPSEEQVVIQILGLIDRTFQTGFDGQYVVSYDPGGRGEDPQTGAPMLCELVTTPDIDQATRFSRVEAIELWRSVDPRRPVRSHDGRPNRPLTAFSVQVDPAPAVEHDGA